MSAGLVFLAGLTTGAVVGYACRAGLDRNDREKKDDRTPGEARDEWQARDSLGRC